jgi:carbonic anhydrase/acetyltransferase-like protein (isoleucine patch superfamily)
LLYRFRDREPRFGDDTYISEHALLIGDVRIGDNCYIGHGSILRGDYGTIDIESGSAVEEGAVMHAPPGGVCHVGKSVTIGHGAVIHSKHIGDYVVIGMGAVVSLYAEVGDETIVAEGCTVRMKQVVPPGVIVTGNPAKVLRNVSEDNRKFWRYGKQLYVDLAKEYLQNGMHRVDA